jgi:hypothetical protein
VGKRGFWEKRVGPTREVIGWREGCWKCGKELIQEWEKSAHQLSILAMKPGSAGEDGTAGVSELFKSSFRARMVDLELLVVEMEKLGEERGLRWLSVRTEAIPKQLDFHQPFGEDERLVWVRK